MKKLIFILGVAIALFVFVACGEAVGSTSTEESPVTTDAPITTEGQIVSEHYTAVPNDFVWESESSGDLPKFNLYGTGKSCVREFSLACNGYTKSYVIIDKDGNEVSSSKKEIEALGFVGGILTKDDVAKTGKLAVREVPCRVEPAFESVSAKGGYYLIFDFTTNMNSAFAVTVTDKEGGAASTAVEKRTGIAVTGESGKYVGAVQLNVPRVKEGKYYINICIDDGSTYPVVASVPLRVTELWFDGPYTLLLTGEWDLITDEDYRNKLIELFYTVYPRQYERWGTDSEHKTVTLKAQSGYEHIAAAQPDKGLVTLRVAYANENPDDIGWFSHEIVHIIQNYGAKLNYTADTKDGYGGWFRENLASYGGFRYFHWGTDAENIQIKDKTSQKVQNWGYAAYGECALFFAYMDDMYPTYDKNGDGKITDDEYGLIDAIHFLIKNNKTGMKYYDTPTATETPIGRTVYAVTGGKYACIEDLRKDFEKACEEDTWDFCGYRDFRDNFITESMDYLPKPKYPMIEPVVHGDKTLTALPAPILSGDNLALNATVVQYSKDVSAKPVSNLLDGNLKSYWLASGIGEYSYPLKGIEQGVTIDLGEVKTFNVYTMVFRGYENTIKTMNVKEWEILVSTDGESFTSLDYQNNNKKDAVSFQFDDVSARYIEIRVYTIAQNITTAMNLNEFMLFKQE